MPNSTIKLTVLRKGEAKPLTFTLTRAVIKIQSVKNKLLDNGYGYVRITQFQEHTTPDRGKAPARPVQAEQGTAERPGADQVTTRGGLLDSGCRRGSGIPAGPILLVVTPTAGSRTPRCASSPIRKTTRGFKEDPLRLTCRKK